jgi:rSAM/selenodomain-associated transferase 2
LLDIIIPTLNEGKRIGVLVERLLQLPDVAQLVIVDASENAADINLIKSLATDPRLTLMIASQKGRAAQMNQGATVCQQPALLFLHCDTTLPDDVVRLVQNALLTRKWGRFDLRLDASGFVFRVIETMINLRSRVTRIATGDQAIFVDRLFFIAQAGFSEIELMEDIEFSRRIGRIAVPGLIKTPVLTSARRWLNHGVVATILLMWKLRILYSLGVRPEKLARMYSHP